MSIKLRVSQITEAIGFALQVGIFAVQVGIALAIAVALGWACAMAIFIAGSIVYRMAG